MADDPNNTLGTLGIGITADYSDLEAKLQGAEDAAAAAGKEIADAFNSAASSGDQLGLFADQAATSFGDLSQQMSLFDKNAIEAADSLTQVGDKLHVVEGETGGATSSIGQFFNSLEFGLPTLDRLTEKLIEVGLEYLAFEKIKEAVEEAITAFENFEKASVALATISHNIDGISLSAEQVGEQMEKLSGLAQSDALSFPSLLIAQQRLVALGVSLEDVTTVLAAIADGAATMGASFDTAAQSFNRMVEGGSLSGRTLLNLGLNTDDVTAAMGLLDVSLKTAKADFQDLEPETRALVLTLAEQAKNAGAAAAQAETMSGAWQRVKNVVEDVGVAAVTATNGFGKLADVASTAAKLIGVTVIDAIQGFHALSTAISLVVDSVGDVIVGLLSAARLITSGDFSGALNSIKGIGADVAGSWSTFLNQIKSDNQTAADSVAKFWNATGESEQKDLDATAIKAKVAAEVQAAEAIKAAEAAQKAAEQFNKSWDLIAQKAENAFGQMEDGGKTAAAVVSTLENAIENATLHFAQLTPASAAMLAQLTAMLLEAKQAEKDLADTEALDKITEQMSALEVKASELADKVPVDFADMMAGVSQGFNFSGIQNQLKTSIQTMTEDLAKIPAELQPTLQIVIDKTQAALSNITDMNNALKLIGQDKSMDQLAQQITSLVNIQDKGQLTAGQFDQALANIGADLTKTVIPALQKGVEVTPQLIDALSKLGPQGQAFADALKGGLDAAVNELTSAAEKIRANALSIDTALKDLGTTSLDAADASVVKYGDDIVAVLKKVADASQLTGAQFAQDQDAVIAWATKVLPSMLEFGTVIQDDVLSQIAKISPAMAQAAKDGPQAFATALDALKVKAADAVMTLAQAYTTLGAQSGEALNNILTKQTDAYNLLVSMNAPVQAQLQGLSDIYQTQIKIAQATGASSTATLAWTQALAGVQSEQAAITQQTMALSNLYTAMLKSFSAEWTQLGNSIGDALVTSQDFGTAFTKVLDDLKKQLADLVVNYLLGELKTALLQDGELMKGFNSVFNAIFGASGSVAQGLTQTQQLVTQTTGELDQIYSNTSKQLTTITSQTVQGIQQTGSAALGQLSSILNMVSGIVTAIASVISAIEIAHTNTILGHIEDNTRVSAILDGQIFEMIHDIDNRWSDFGSFINGTLTQYLQNINVDLDGILGVLQEIKSSGGFSGSGGSSGVDGGSSLGQTVSDLETQVTAIGDVLKQGVQGTSAAAAASTNSAAASAASAIATGGLTTATQDLTPSIVNLATAVGTAVKQSNPNSTASQNVNFMSASDFAALQDATNRYQNPLQFNIPGSQQTAGQGVQFLSPTDQKILIDATNAFQHPLQFNIPNSAGSGQVGSTGTPLGGTLAIAQHATTITVPVTISGNVIGTQQIASQITDQVQSKVVATLRQAGLKI